jgi:hypothetical protein
MIQLIAAGIWGALVALGTAYGTLLYLQNPPAAPSAAGHGHIEQIKTKLITVPMAREGHVEGYMRVQFAFSVEKSELAKLPVKPDIILVDEAYRSMTEYRFQDPRRPTRAEITKITETLKAAIDRRMGAALVSDVWVQDYSFVALSNVRGDAAK